MLNFAESDAPAFNAAAILQPCTQGLAARVGHLLDLGYSMACRHVVKGRDGFGNVIYGKGRGRDFVRSLFLFCFLFIVYLFF